MVNEHLSLTKTEADARLTGDHAIDVATFDALYKHAVHMSDGFTIGIVKQFENEFKVDRNGDREKLTSLPASIFSNASQFLSSSL